MTLARHALAVALAWGALGCGRFRYASTPSDAATSDVNLDAGPSVDAFVFTDVAFDAGPMQPTFGVRSGIDHSCALQSGMLVCAGANAKGQLGLGDVAERTALTGVEVRPWVDLAVGYESTCARTDYGEVFCFGANNEGQLGLGDTNARMRPTRVAFDRPIAHLALGYDHACAIQIDGSLHCWGQNFEGQLGQDDAEPGVPGTLPLAVAPGLTFGHVACGQGHTCAITSAGELYCWGRSTSSELGISVATHQLRVPTRIGTERYRSIAAGQSNTCAITAAGQLACWGADEDADTDAGPGGLTTSGIIETPTVIDTRTDWTEVSTDTFHSCGIRADNTLHCWGRNLEGQFGLGDNSTQHQTPMQIGTDTDWIHVGVGRFYTCAQKRDGSVWCTGALPITPGDGVMRRNTFIRL